MKPTKKKSQGQINRSKSKGGKASAANWQNRPIQPVPKRYTRHV